MDRSRLVGWVAASALFVLACQAKLASIHVRDTAITTVEEGSIVEDLVGDFGFDDFTAIDITSSTELANQGVEPGDIKDVELVAFSLTATDPDGADLSWLESVDLLVEAPGLPQEVVAHADDFPEGVATVDFELDGVDLTPYALSESMTLVVEASGHRPKDTTTVEADYDLKIGVTGQGCANAIGKAGE